MFKLSARSLLCLVLALWLGCVPRAESGIPARPPRRALVVDTSDSAHCARGAVSAEAPLPGSEELAPASEGQRLLAGALPEQVRRTATAAGLDRLLVSILEEQSIAGAPSNRLLLLRLSLAARLEAAGAQLSSVEFEADCTRDVIQQVLDEVDRRKRSRELAFTISSLLMAAVTSAVAGAWDLKTADSHGPAVVGIAGGTATAALGVTAFAPARQSIVYAHQRNLLAPIIRGQDPSQLLPPLVFRLLTMPYADGKSTPREELVTRWRRLIAAAVAPGERARVETLLFGGGGVYDTDLTKLRQQLFDELESELDSFARDLELLNHELVRLQEDHADPGS